MENATLRKVTSIALMSIMVAGGLTFAIPGVTPDAHAAPKIQANLAVSTDRFGGPMVVEISVNDPALIDTDENKAEPDVTFNGHDLKMIQGGDGAWYAYVANYDSVLAFDDAGPDTRHGMNFGAVCEENEDEAALFIDESEDDNISKVSPFAEVVKVYVANATCNGQGTESELVNNVIRDPQNPSGAFGATPNLGNNDLSNAGYWPFIQTFTDLVDDSPIKVIYGKSGSPQEITITYIDEMDEFSSLSYDRAEYPKDAYVHLTMNDEILNIDPTDEDVWTFDISEATTAEPVNQKAYYQLVNDAGVLQTATPDDVEYSTEISATHNGFGDPAAHTGYLTIDLQASGTSDALMIVENTDLAHYMDAEHDIQLTSADNLVTFQETSPNSGVFKNTENLKSDLKTTDLRKASFTIEYNDGSSNRIIETNDGIITMDTAGVGSAWNSGEPITVTVTDHDFNKNSLDGETLEYNDAPSILINDQSRIQFVEPRAEDAVTPSGNFGANGDTPPGRDSETGILTAIQGDSGNDIYRVGGNTDNNSPFDKEILDFFNTQTEDQEIWFQYDFPADVATGTSINIIFGQFFDGMNTAPSGNRAPPEANAGFLSLGKVFPTNDNRGFVQIEGKFTPGYADNENDFRYQVHNGNIAIDESYLMKLWKFNGSPSPYFLDNTLMHDQMTPISAILPERDNEPRIELDETGPNTGVFSGTIEYVMANQIRDPENQIRDTTVDSGFPQVSVDTKFEQLVTIRLADDQLDEDSVRVEYLDVDGQGVDTTKSAQADAPTHSGAITLDATNYKQADTVLVTITDADLNQDSEIRDIYPARTDGTNNRDTIAKNDDAPPSDDKGSILLLEASFNAERWVTCDNSPPSGGNPITGFGTQISSLTETGTDTGIFTADFQIPSHYCAVDAPGAPSESIPTTLGKDLEVTYYDFLDAAGERNEAGAAAGITATTGSVSFDKSVYPVPFGHIHCVPRGETQCSEPRFPIHELTNGMDGNAKREMLLNLNDAENTGGDVTVHIQVNDRDFDTSASGVDTMPVEGNLKVTITRGAASEEVEITDTTIRETAGDTGIFELDLPIAYDMGPHEQCPAEFDKEAAEPSGTDGRGTIEETDGCLLQGDIITVEYSDPSDASGNINTVTDSATFDLRNGVLQSDKSVYIIGSDMILTLIDPDLDLDNDGKQSYTLDLIEWDSDAAEVTMGERGDGLTSEGAIFDPEPSSLQETGDSTGIFQSVVEIPSNFDDEALERGEEITLEYIDWGPSGAQYVGDESEDIQLTVFTSNFGATIELDQNVYTWTDKVFITITAPDHNFDSNLIDEIGENDNPINVGTRSGDIDNYRLVETGSDTGIFSGEVILTGFAHNADGDTDTGLETSGSDTTPRTTTGATGPTNGFIEADDEDGISVSFEFSEDETVIKSAIIRWNIGEVQWLEAAYPAAGNGVVRVIDPDMNLNPEAVNNFVIDVVSDQDSKGISLTVTETNVATGIFEGTVLFTTTDSSSGHRLRVAEGDTITADYGDYTLPKPYTTADNLDITATALIGTIVPPLERVPVSNLRLVDPQGSTISTVQVDQQISIAADLQNAQEKEQKFAYLVQVQNSDRVTVHLSWIDGSLVAGQTFVPTQSWIPAEAGVYTATVFVWESVSNPTALSPPVETTITVS